MVLPIQLPHDAPFTAEQRAWLNNFLSQILAQGDGAAPASGPAIPVTVLYASQTGTAEGLAKKLIKALKKGNFAPELQDMATYDRTRLTQEKNLLLITSTYGDGEPPDSAAEFHAWLMNAEAPRLESLSYSVLALGDTSYPDFCKCGIEFDTRLEALGATRIYPRVDVDVDPDAPYAQWSAGVIAALTPAGFQIASRDESAAEAEESGYSKSNPFPAAVLENRNLNGPGDKQTHQIALSLENSDLTYEVGDALGVYPLNPANVVDEIIANLPFKASEVPAPDGSEVPLRHALIHHYDIGSLNKSIIQKWQVKSGSPFLRSLVAADDKKAYDDFCWGRDLIDLVIDHPADFNDAEEFVSVLKKLQPRLYSIASSPRTHPGEVHLCVGVVRYQTFGRQRGGICSTFLADRLTSAQPPRVYVHSNNAFRLPSDASTDVIMVGPGTGIAPFRAFLECRKTTAAAGRNWLFFGNPHRASDYLYQDELEAFQADGTLAKLDLAWSRDQKEKLYVQHLMLQNGAELWSWLQNGAAFYVCGDASRMAKDVDQALLQIATEHGQLSPDEATAFISQLKKDKRYQRDVY
jgi:sulfite reductase (NADPH) flavoprotein alpha-component